MCAIHGLSIYRIVLLHIESSTAGQNKSLSKGNLYFMNAFSIFPDTVLSPALRFSHMVEKSNNGVPVDLQHSMGLFYFFVFWINSPHAAPDIC